MVVENQIGNNFFLVEVDEVGVALAGDFLPEREVDLSDLVGVSFGCENLFV